MRALVTALLSLWVTQVAAGTLDCSKVSQVIPEVADISYAEDDSHLRYELAYDLAGYHWTGTAFEFHRPFGGNPLFVGVADDPDVAPSREVVTNFRNVLLDMDIHPGLTEPRRRQTKHGEVVIFEALDDAFPLVYGLHVRLTPEGVQVLRVSGIAPDAAPAQSSEASLPEAHSSATHSSATHSSEEPTVNALTRLIKSCLSNEA